MPEGGLLPRDGSVEHSIQKNIQLERKVERDAGEESLRRSEYLFRKGCEISVDNFPMGR